jgi:tight adherence protein C
VTAALVLGAGALLLALVALAELLARSDPRRTRQTPPEHSPIEHSVAARSGTPFALVAERLGLRARVARAGLADRIPVHALLAAKLGGGAAGALWGLVLAPAAPGRLAWIVAGGLPVAGFLGPDVWLERRARARLRALRARLPDALDLLAVGTSAGRSPLAGLTELGEGEGPLAEELAVLSAESSCGAPQSAALASLRRRAPVREVAAMCGVIERSHRYGSPLADQLHEQAAVLRAAQRRRIEEEAAKAAPKIQLAVALLLVPSVLLMIAAGLLANVDRFLSGV